MHSTLKFTNNVSVLHGDKFRPNDYILDKLHLSLQLSKFLELLFTFPAIISGCNVTLTTTLDISSGVLIAKNEPHSLVITNYNGSPLQTLSLERSYTFISFQSFSTQFPANGNYYVGLRYKEKEIQARGYATDPLNTYIFCVEDSIEAFYTTSEPEFYIGTLSYTAQWVFTPKVNQLYLKQQLVQQPTLPENIIRLQELTDHTNSLNPHNTGLFHLSDTNVNNRKITNLTNGTDNLDAVNKSQLDTTQLSINTHKQTINTDHQIGLSHLTDTNVNNRKLNNVTSGTDSLDAVNKGQLDSVQSSLNSSINQVQTNLNNHNHNGIYATLDGLNKVVERIDYSKLDNVPSSFTPSNHTHTTSQITDIATGQWIQLGGDLSFVDTTSDCVINGYHLRIIKIGNFFTGSGYALLTKNATNIYFGFKKSTICTYFGVTNLVCYGVAAGKNASSIDQRGWISDNDPPGADAGLRVFLTDAANGVFEVFFSFTGYFN